MIGGIAVKIKKVMNSHRLSRDWGDKLNNPRKKSAEIIAI